MIASHGITRCRACGGALDIPFCDLGETPLANAFIPPEQANELEQRFPLRVLVCADCRLAQLDHIVDASAIFSDYAYFSSFSSTWLDHAARFAREMREDLALGPGSLVVEAASNDGYLLRNFVAARVPCLGVEPAANVAAAARAAGVPTETCFFGRQTAERLVAQHGLADLAVANNVLAHVPDVNDFVAGLAVMVDSRGIVSIEVPHLLALINEAQFDTIYHEHYAYWSLLSMERLLAAHGLRVFRAERLATHGTSLRVQACAANRAAPRAPDRLAELRAAEQEAGLGERAIYESFQPRVARVIAGFKHYLADRRVRGIRVGAYGAAAKGNTLLNACGATVDDIALVADRNPAKQGRLCPGSRIPVVTPQALVAARPDEVVILPWNIATEVAEEFSRLPGWSGRLLVAVPELRFMGSAWRTARA